MENALANHEFEKARFYSDEERKERENLSALREKYKIDETTMGAVTRQDIEEVWCYANHASVRPIKESVCSESGQINVQKEPGAPLGK